MLKFQVNGIELEATFTREDEDDNTTSVDRKFIYLEAFPVIDDCLYSGEDRIWFEDGEWGMSSNWLQPRVRNEYVSSVRKKEFTREMNTAIKTYLESHPELWDEGQRILNERAITSLKKWIEQHKNGIESIQRRTAEDIAEHQEQIDEYTKRLNTLTGGTT